MQRMKIVTDDGLVLLELDNLNDLSHSIMIRMYDEANNLTRKQKLVPVMELTSDQIHHFQLEDVA